MTKMIIVDAVLCREPTTIIFISMTIISAISFLHKNMYHLGDVFFYYIMSFISRNVLSNLSSINTISVSQNI